MPYSDQVFTGPDLCKLPARGALRMLKSGEVSPAQLLDAAWQRMDQVEPAVNATVIRHDDRARAALNALPEHGQRNAGARGWLRLPRTSQLGWWAPLNSLSNSR